MSTNLLKSGYATLEYEIAQEKASTLARLGTQLEAALTALAAHPQTSACDPKIRLLLVEKAGYALWQFVVHREACGLNNIAYVLEVYKVPTEVQARMSPPVTKGGRAPKPAAG